MTRAAILGFLLAAASACAEHEVATSGVFRCGVPSIVAPVAHDPYVLGDLKVEGRELLVHLDASGGCAEHSFSACWDGSVYLTSPPSLDVMLRHDAHGDRCDAQQSYDLRFDLTMLVEAVDPPLWLWIKPPGQQIDPAYTVRVPE